MQTSFLGIWCESFVAEAVHRTHSHPGSIVISQGGLTEFTGNFKMAESHILAIYLGKCQSTFNNIT